jgi:SpoVK/Ycf46/Vps4 family AAA+-type ATPase
VPVVDGVHAAIRRAPLLMRPVLAALSVALLPWLLAPICVFRGVRTVMASLYTAAFWAWIYLLISANRLNTHAVPTASGGHSSATVPATWLLAMLVTPFLIAGLANVRPLSRWFIPCRTVAWSLLWSSPVVFFIVQASPQNTMFAVIAIWVIAAALIGWRAAKGSQEARMFGPDGPLARSGQGPAAPPAAPPGPAEGGPASRRTGPTPRNGTGGHSPAQYSTRAQGVAQVYADHASREPQSTAAAADKPQITPEEALAELDAMIGLGAVKEQVRSIAVSIEAARRRAVAGFGTDKPMRHFVFLGPPGTGKTTVARVIGKIFYSFGLLDTPEVVEAQRSDLVGEYLGATAIKTNDLIDSALGRVLFIDEAYSLVNEGDGQSDRFGAEAVQTLLKRAEDDRENLIIILAGYEKQTETFLATNPGMASRFATRIRFPTYSTEELLALAEMQLRGKQEGLAPDARPVLWRMLDEVGRRRITDELGNGRFVRTLLEKAGQARDVRVMGGGGDPQAEDLITIGGADLERAFSELTSRLRGYENTPTLESAIAELDELVGLEPVKQQVRAIAAQLRVAKLRDRQGLASQPPVRHFVFTGPPGHGQDHGGPDPRPDLRRARPAGAPGGRRGAPRGPGRRAPRVDLAQDQPAGRLRARRRAVRRRGVLAAQRGLLGRRRVRHGGGADAAQAGRGRPGPPGDRARRVPGRHGAVPALQPGPGLPVQHPGHLPQLHRARPVAHRGHARRAGRGRLRAGGRPCPGVHLRPGRAGRPDRRSRQRPVRPFPVRARVRLPRRPRRPAGRIGHRRGPDHADSRRRPRRLRRAHRLTA